MDFNDQSDDDISEDSEDYEDLESLDFGSDFDFELNQIWKKILTHFPLLVEHQVLLQSVLYMGSPTCSSQTPVSHLLPSTSTATRSTVCDGDDEGSDVESDVSPRRKIPRRSPRFVNRKRPGQVLNSTPRGTPRSTCRKSLYTSVDDDDDYHANNVEMQSESDELDDNQRDIFYQAPSQC